MNKKRLLICAVSLTVASAAFAGVLATGGSTTNDIDGWRVHTFTNSATAGNFEVMAGGLVEVLVVGGGGGGGETIGGGGGGGGVIYSNAYPVIVSNYTVIVGKGGAGGWGSGYPPGVRGSNSVFGGLTAIGGGAGGGFNLPATGTGGSAGGNGGGGGARAGYTPDQGNDGGIHWNNNAGGGGGGAGQAGADGTGGGGGKGGDGFVCSITGARAVYAGGGGGGTRNTSGPDPGDGGAGGGGRGGRTTAGVKGMDNTGGGGGGGGYVGELAGGPGGSGIVIVRYKRGIGNAGGATSVTPTSAWLNGTLHAVDETDTAVLVFWGENDGEMNLTGWARTNTWVAPREPGDFTVQATGLAPNFTYFYRFAASNETGWIWAPESSAFITGDVWIEKTADASEIGPTPGTFTVHRVSGAANGDLIVNLSVNGTAEAGIDYVALSGTVTIPDGEETATIEVLPVFDHFLEGPETVSVTVAPGPYVVGSSSNALVEIADYGLEIRTWSGGGANANASTAANWVEGEAPVAGDAIVLDSRTNKSMTWDLNIPVQSWTQDGYTGTVTVATVYPGQGAFATFTILGDCVISNGVWTHAANPSSVTNINNELYRLKVAVGGDLIVGEAGSIDVAGKGYAEQTGPGYAASSGGSHGGSGGFGYPPRRPSTAPCYGSVTAPTNLGSGGLGTFSAGGGAVMVTVDGTIINNGLIGADGLINNRGAGGSVYLVSGALLGTGIIRANGGQLDNNSPAGGGRVALIQTNASDFTGYTGAIQAYRGNTNLNYACSGTIYLEKKGDAPGGGALIIDNLGVAPMFRLATDLNGIEPVTYAFSRITLTNAGCLQIGAGNTVIAHNTVIESHGLESGIWLSGGTLDVQSGFSWSNCFIGVSATGSVFNPVRVGTNAVLILDAPHLVTNDLTVQAGGRITHSDNGAEELYRMDLTVLGDLTVMSEGRIDVVGKGHGIGQGPGSGYGASYGGVGSAGKPTYGSLLAPTNIGSGGGFSHSKGGGAIQLQVSGILSNDGVISANGVEPGNARPASGGSVYITAGALSGTGVIQADGTQRAGTSLIVGGGGGRVSVVLTNSSATFTAFSGRTHAFGGSPGDAYNAGAGTIYVQNGADRPGRGVIRVNNEDRLKMGYTDVPPGTNSVSGEADYAIFRISDAGRLRLTNDFTMGDIWLDTANAILDLGSNTLTVNTREHELGLGTVTNWGEIIWRGLPPGVLIIVK